MNKSDVTDMIVERKNTAGLTWAGIAEGIGLSEVFTTSACLGMNSMPRDKADTLVKNLGLPQEAAPVQVGVGSLVCAANCHTLFSGHKRNIPRGFDPPMPVEPDSLASGTMTLPSSMIGKSSELTCSVSIIRAISATISGCLSAMLFFSLMSSLRS